jgi:hypothetical protein
LFSEEVMPWKVYEQMLTQATPRDNQQSFTLDGIDFTLEKGKKDERIIFCP